MSQENVEVVRQPIAMGARSRRRLEERLALRFPRALAVVARATWMLPPRSRLRQALVRFAVRAGFDAINRGDYEPPFAFYDPAGELITPPQLVGLGFDSLYHGPEQRIAFQRKWVAEWGEFRAEVEEIIDLGDRVLLVGRIKGTGPSSGAAFDEQWADLLTVSAGRVVIERVFFDHGRPSKPPGFGSRALTTRPGLVATHTGPLFADLREP